MSGGSRGSGGGPAMGGPEPALRGGGLPLPGLKHWRLRRDLSQTELARRAELKDGYIARIESGRRGCNPETAQLLADLLKADLRDLRRNHDDAAEAGAPPRPARPRIAYRHVHQAYLKILLEGAVGSAYAAMEEWEIEKRFEGGTWEGVLEAVRARGREIGFLEEAIEARGCLGSGPARGGALVPEGGDREPPRSGHPPARGGPQARAFRGGARGAHGGHEGAAVTREWGPRRPAGHGAQRILWPRPHRTPAGGPEGPPAARP